MSEPSRAMENLMAFWADAGVDVAYDDAPHDRMAAGPQHRAVEVLEQRLDVHRALQDGQQVQVQASPPS